MLPRTDSHDRRLPPPGRETGRDVLLNVDAAERHPDDPIDLQLLPWVDAVNVALGAHAGDAAWSREYARRATDQGVQVHLHPGYPDLTHFGRKPLAIDWHELQASLDDQRRVLPDVAICKFHGALYNQAMQEPMLADRLAAWCRRNEIQTVLAMPDSCLATSALAEGRKILFEGFADRRYQLNARERLELVPRREPGSVIDHWDEFALQVTHLTSGKIRTSDGTITALNVDTLCLHGDEKHALLFAKAIHHWKRTGLWEFPADTSSG